MPPEAARGPAAALRRQPGGQVAVVLVNWNGAADTLATLASLDRCAAPSGGVAALETTGGTVGGAEMSSPAGNAAPPGGVAAQATTGASAGAAGSSSPAGDAAPPGAVRDASGRP